MPLGEELENLWNYPLISRQTWLDCILKIGARVVTRSLHTAVKHIIVGEL